MHNNPKSEHPTIISPTNFQSKHHKTIHWPEKHTHTPTEIHQHSKTVDYTIITGRSRHPKPKGPNQHNQNKGTQAIGR